VKILADSACDLTKEYYQQYDIDIVPLTVHLNENEYKDQMDISPKEIYDAMREGQTPTTSQVTPQMFDEIFIFYANTGQPLIYLAFYAKLSGKYQKVKMIDQNTKEKFPNAIIYVIDTKCASIGYGLVVLRAAQLAQEVADIEQ